MARAGEMGYPSVLTAKTWGFYDVFPRPEFKFQRPYGCYVMENVLFKISYPAEFHAQTAVEAAMKLHARTGNSGSRPSEAIRDITMRTHEACLRIIDKKGPLQIPPTATIACNTWSPFRCSLAGSPPPTTKTPWQILLRPAHRRVRAKIDCSKSRGLPRDYHDPEKRSIASCLRMELNDGTVLEETVEYPIGHRRRREEGLPLLVEKFKTNLRRRFTEAQQERILDASLNAEKLDAMPVNEYVDLYVP